MVGRRPVSITDGEGRGWTKNPEKTVRGRTEAGAAHAGKNQPHTRPGARGRGP